MSCDSAHLEGDDERVTCEWSNVSADDAWDVVDDDPDEQDIRHVDGGDNEPHDSESDIDLDMDSCAAEFVIPFGLVTSPVRRSEGTFKEVLYRGASGCAPDCEEIWPVRTRRLHREGEPARVPRKAEACTMQNTKFCSIFFTRGGVRDMIKRFRQTSRETLPASTHIIPFVLRMSSLATAAHLAVSGRKADFQDVLMHKTSLDELLDQQHGEEHQRIIIVDEKDKIIKQVDKWRLDNRSFGRHVEN